MLVWYRINTRFRIGVYSISYWHCLHRTACRITSPVSPQLLIRLYGIHGCLWELRIPIHLLLEDSTADKTENIIQKLDETFEKISHYLDFAPKELPHILRRFGLSRCLTGHLDQKTTLNNKEGPRHLILMWMPSLAYNLMLQPRLPASCRLYLEVLPMLTALQDLSLGPRGRCYRRFQVRCFRRYHDRSGPSWWSSDKRFKLNSSKEYVRQDDFKYPRKTSNPRKAIVNSPKITTSNSFAVLETKSMETSDYAMVESSEPGMAETTPSASTKVMPSFLRMTEDNCSVIEKI